MKLVFIHGMPGVGKLTVARDLAKLTGFKLFHNHLTVDLVGSVFEFGSQPFVELREKIWLDVFSGAAANKIEGLIFTFAFEPTVSANFIENVRHLIESKNGKVLFIKLQCSAITLEQRLTDSSRAKFGKLTSLAQFRELQEAGAFDDPEIIPNQLVLDTTMLSPAEAAAQIASELKL